MPAIDSPTYRYRFNGSNIQDMPLWEAWESTNFLFEEPIGDIRAKATKYWNFFKLLITLIVLSAVGLGALLYHQVAHLTPGLVLIVIVVFAAYVIGGILTYRGTQDIEIINYEKMVRDTLVLRDALEDYGVVSTDNGNSVFLWVSEADWPNYKTQFILFMIDDEIILQIFHGIIDTAEMKGEFDIEVYFETQLEGIASALRPFGLTLAGMTEYGDEVLRRHKP